MEISYKKENLYIIQYDNDVWMSNEMWWPGRAYWQGGMDLSQIPISLHI